MKLIIQDKEKFVLRFDKDEEVMEGLVKFMAEQKMEACIFFGIGACRTVELAFYNIHLKSYRSKPIMEDAEILSLSGNGSMLDGQPTIHAHGVFGRNEFSTFGGHVNKLVISATCEIHLTKLEAKMERKLNADLNLNTLV